MKSRNHVTNRIFLHLLLSLSLYSPAVLSQSMVLQRGSEKFPVKELPDGGRSVVVDGRTYFLVAKEDLAALTRESESMHARAAGTDTLIAVQNRLLEQYARYESVADTLATRQDLQIQQAEKIARTYDEFSQDLKRLAGFSSWSITAGIGLQTPDANAKLMGSVGVGYRHWMAEYQFAKNYGGVVVGFRMNL